MVLTGPSRTPHLSIAGLRIAEESLRSTHTPATQELCDQAVLPLVLITAATSLDTKRCTNYRRTVGQGIPSEILNTWEVEKSENESPARVSA